MTVRRWLSATALFFAWGFVMHAAGLLLHELGGHAVAAEIFGCGIEGYRLTYFGHGQVHIRDCGWTEKTILVCDWAGLVLTSGAGLAAALVMRRWRAPSERLLVALVAYFFLLGQLGYATQGGFHDLYDPGRTARILGAHGLHPLAWIPPLVGYAAASVFCSGAAIDAFREQFGGRTRLRTLGYLASTLGVAGALYWLAFRIERQLRTDLTMRGVEVEAERQAVVRHVEPPFPIHLVMLGISAVALAWALARPAQNAETAQPISRRAVHVVAASAAFFFVLLTALILRA